MIKSSLKQLFAILLIIIGAAHAHPNDPRIFVVHENNTDKEIKAEKIRIYFKNHNIVEIDVSKIPTATKTSQVVPINNIAELEEYYINDIDYIETVCREKSSTEVIEHQVRNSKLSNSNKYMFSSDLVNIIEQFSKHSIITK